MGRQDFPRIIRQNRHFTHLQERCRLFKRHLAALVPFAFTVWLDIAVVAKAAHPRSRPAIAPARSACRPGSGASAIARSGICRARRLTSVIDVGLGAPPVLAGPVLAHAQRGVIAALPVDAPS